jgi:DNA polymerase III delta prime subunit
MKYLSTKFEDYIQESEKNDLHKDMKIIYNLYNNIDTLSNYIFYGPPGIGKYTQTLNFIKKFSPSGLKYERKINIQLNAKKQYNFKLSDIHIEIDMALLGCNAKVLFNEIYNNALDIFSTRQNHFGFIFCKNFHCIHNELLDVFYSYMQTLAHKNIKIVYVLITEQISFIPDNILNRSEIIAFKRPTKTNYNKCLKNVVKKDTNLSKITNIKNLITNITELDTVNSKITNKIINNIENYKNLNFLEFRDIIYDIFIYNIDLNECLYDIIGYFIDNKKITQDKLDIVFDNLYKFFRFYNNNYRPIYHLERYLYILCKVIYEL